MGDGEIFRQHCYCHYVRHVIGSVFWMNIRVFLTDKTLKWHILFLNKKLCLRNTIDAPSRQNQSHKVKGHSQGH